VVGFIAEFSLSLWLLIKGVNEEEYNTKKAEILAKM
jgi:hypothetical protein